ncbi:MAG TPA: hypothetical protein ENI23_16025 [bacterium]|nr:hypothetical protein [bacterium]
MANEQAIRRRLRRQAREGKKVKNKVVSNHPKAFVTQPLPHPKQRDYPLVYIPLAFLDYRWGASHWDTKQRLTSLVTYSGWEARLRNWPVGPYEEKDKRIKGVYKHILENGMRNYIAVKQHSYGSDFDGTKYYVVVGNQRLAVLRALPEEKQIEFFGERKLIPCRICLFEDNWTDQTEVMRWWPYTKINTPPI